MLTKNILIITGASLLLTGTATAAIPNTPGPYIGVYAITDTSARISYLDNASDEDGFKVYIYDNTNGILDMTLSPNPIIVPKNDGGSQYQYTDLTNLIPNQFYEVRVTAFNSDGESNSTDPSSEKGGRLYTTDTCIPEMPGEYVGVWNITSSSARISFMDNSDDEDGFKAYVYNYNTDVLVDTILLDSVSGKGGYQYTDITGLDANTLYKVKISAHNGCGESKRTTPSSITNGRFRTKTNSCPIMPGEYVGVYNVTSTGARISFLDNSDNESGFKAYIYDYNTDVLIDTILIPAINGVGGHQYANITGLTPNTLYKVKVSAFNSSCESPTTTPSSLTNGRFRTQP
jgi:hypothetical protein